MADTMLSLKLNDCKTVHDKLNYLESRMWIVQSVIYGYYFTIVGWFFCLGFMGLVKYSRDTYIPFAYSGVGVTGIVIGTLYLHYARRSVDVETPKIRSKKILTMDEVNVSINHPANLTSLGFSMIFLGGVAFKAITFFDFRGRNYEYFYLNVMCLSFTTSMW